MSQFSPDVALACAWILLVAAFVAAIIVSAVLLRHIDSDEDARAALRRKDGAQ